MFLCILTNAQLVSANCAARAVCALYALRALYALCTRCARFVRAARALYALYVCIKKNKRTNVRLFFKVAV